MLTIMGNEEGSRKVGQKVRTMRRAQHLTQEELAMAAGVGRGVLQKLEEGRGTVNLASVIRIAQALSSEIRLVSRQTAQPQLTPPGVDNGAQTEQG